MNRTLESTAEPEGVPWLWRQYAYRGYLLLQALDRAVLEPRLPAAIFYNLLISARAPALAATRARLPGTARARRRAGPVVRHALAAAAAARASPA